MTPGTETGTLNVRLTRLSMGVCAAAGIAESASKVTAQTMLRRIVPGMYGPKCGLLAWNSNEFHAHYNKKFYADVGGMCAVVHAPKLQLTEDAGKLLEKTKIITQQLMFGEIDWAKARKVFYGKEEGNFPEAS